jgi:hypothetical protein
LLLQSNERGRNANSRGGTGRRPSACGAESLLYDEYKEDGSNCGSQGARARICNGQDGEYDGNGRGGISRAPTNDWDEDEECTGIPDLPLMMRVDIQGKFGREKSVMAFQTSFGSLPAMATLDITEMMYAPSTAQPLNQGRCKRRRGDNENDGDDGEGSETNEGEESSGALSSSRLPKEIFLSYPYIMQSYSRWKMYKSNEFSMDALKKSGCESHMLNRIMNVVRNTTDAYEKLDLFNDYLQRITRQHMSSVMNNDLRSTHAMFTAKYIEQGKSTLCTDLRKLIGQISPGFYNFMGRDKAASQVCVFVCVQKRDLMFCVRQSAPVAENPLFDCRPQESQFTA